MTDMILTLLGLGYTVTFESDHLGGCFCLLRILDSMELVNCAIGNSPEEALEGATAWAMGTAPGNGTGDRPAAFTQPERLSALEFGTEALVLRIDGLEARLSELEAVPIDRRVMAAIWDDGFQFGEMDEAAREVCRRTRARQREELAKVLGELLTTA